jgi:hypothetical protein
MMAPVPTEPKLTRSISPSLPTQPFQFVHPNSPLCTPLFISVCRLILNALQRPALRAPPPLMPEGALVQPEPEKTFVQKYWMILIAVLFFLRKSLSIFK